MLVKFRGQYGGGDWEETEFELHGEYRFMTELEIKELISLLTHNVKIEVEVVED